MSNLAQYTILLVVLTFCSCSYKPHIVGEWRADTGPEKQQIFRFKKNGTLLINKQGKTDIMNWEYAHNKRLITFSQKDHPEAVHFVLNYLDPIFMGISNQTTSYNLTRTLKVKSLNYTKAMRKLKGNWSLVQIEDSLATNQDIQLSFWDNGVYQEKQNSNQQLGRWTLSNDTKKLTLKNSDYTQTIGLSFSKKNHIQIEDNYGTYLLKRTERTQKTPSNKKVAARILGAWMLSKVGNEQLDNSNYTMYLNVDGSLKIFENNHISELGKWSVSQDGAFLILQHSDNEISYPIEDISYNKLNLMDNFQSIAFKRVKLF